MNIQTRNNGPRGYGPWLVGLGAALWGTESAWRIPLNELFDADVIVFWEHVLILLMFLPLLLPSLGDLRKIDISTWGYLLFSGFAGSAVGTIFFTLALKRNGNERGKFDGEKNTGEDSDRGIQKKSRREAVAEKEKRTQG